MIDEESNSGGSRKDVGRGQAAQASFGARMVVAGVTGQVRTSDVDGEARRRQRLMEVDGRLIDGGRGDGGEVVVKMVVVVEVEGCRWECR